MPNLSQKLLLVFILVLGVNATAFSNAEKIFSNNVRGVGIIVSDEGQGSATIITKSGYLLSNYHVVRNAKNLEILLYGFDNYEDALFNIELIKYNAIKDLALLKIVSPPSNLDPIKVSKVKQKVGSEVHTIGHPEGEIWSYSRGYISQYRFEYTWHYKNSEQAYSADVYQVQAPLSNGSSGGPLLNKSGNLIGINTFGSKKTNGVNFSITVEEIIGFLLE